MSGIGARYLEVLGRVEAAASAAGRAGQVSLVAVSKTHPAESVVAAFEAGARDFGENRVDELVRKREEVAALLGEAAGQVRWHMIGQLQSRKIKGLGHVHLIHSIDRESQLGALARLGGPTQDVLVEVNIGREPQKGGVMPEALEAFCGAVAATEGVRLRGLMTIPPDRDDDVGTLEDFRQMSALFERLRAVHGEDFEVLSMGMSGDFELAVVAGATLVRVGTAIFGERGSGA